MLDIIIPTIRTQVEIAPLVAEIEQTAGCPVRAYATCQQIAAAHNRNIGLDWARSDVRIMVDDDVEQFPQGWAVKLVDVMASNPECVMVSPQLAKPDGSPGFMMGGCNIGRSGVSEARERKLPTACVAVRKNALRFNPTFKGSGFEDDDYCAQLRMAFPSAKFLVCHDVWVVHRNETKNQHGPFWAHNKALYERLWCCR